MQPPVQRPTDLGTFPFWTFRLEPVLDAGEAKEVSATQGGEPVLAGSRPRLKADGAVVTFTFLSEG